MDGLTDALELLELAPDCSEEDVRRAYRRMALKHHPDKNNGHDVDGMFAKLTAACHLIEKERSPVRRSCGGGGASSQDDWIRQRLGTLFPGIVFGASQQAFQKTFQQTFSGVFGGSTTFHDPPGPRSRPPPSNTEKVVDLTLRELRRGCRKRVEVLVHEACPDCELSQQEGSCGVCSGSGQMGVQIMPEGITLQMTCHACLGSGRAAKPKRHCGSCGSRGSLPALRTVEVDIAAGLPDGYGCNVAEQGSYDVNTGRKGNLHIVVKHHLPQAVRLDGLDVHHDIDVDVRELLCGFSRRILIYGDDDPVDVATDRGKYFCPAQVITVAGAGLSKHGGGTGDLVVHVRPTFPASMPEANKFGEVLARVFFGAQQK